jgi:signal transduction histidine kinase
MRAVTKRRALIANERKHSMASALLWSDLRCGGWISVSAVAEGQALVIAVRDTGDGLEPE